MKRNPMAGMPRLLFPQVLVVALLVVLAASNAHAQRTSVHLDPANTEIRWTLTDTLHTVKGTFKLKRGEISFDPRTGAAEGEIVVDASSGDSGSGMRDSRMKSHVLETDKYPQVVYRPAKVAGDLKPGATQDLTVDGVFSIHGQDHPLRLGVRVQLEGNRVTATTHFLVPYVAWGMKDPSNFAFKVGKQVDVTVVSHGTIEAAP